MDSRKPRAFVGQGDELIKKEKERDAQSKKKSLLTIPIFRFMNKLLSVSVELKKKFFLINCNFIIITFGF